MSSPVVSVLFPVRNTRPYLDDAIRSIEQQTYTALEVLAVDDGSSDGSGDLLRAWAARDARVRVLAGGTPERPVGIVGALEAARAAATGPFLARMDGDDLTPPDRFEKQVRVLETDASVSVCGASIRYIPREGLTGGARAYERWINGLDTHEDMERDLFVECPVAHPTFMMRSSAYDEIGGYSDGPWPEDYDLLLRLWEAGGRMAKANGCIHLWRDHPDRLSRSDSRYSIDAFQALKCRVLARTSLATGPGSAPGGTRPPVVWGAGPTGKAFARHLIDLGRRPDAFVELDPRKIGQTIHGVRVLAPGDLGPPRGRFGLGAVSGAVPRREIRAAFEALGWTDGKDFRAVA